MADDTTTIKGIEQGRAKFAYECAKEAKQNLGSNFEKYKNYVKSLPMYIKTNGLGATFAFMLSKRAKVEGPVYAEIGNNILEWSRRDAKNLIKMSNIDNFEKLTSKIVELNSPEYRALTIEVLAFFNWLRRFADGLIEGDENG